LQSYALLRCILRASSIECFCPNLPLERTDIQPMGIALVIVKSSGTLLLDHSGSVFPFDL